MRASPPALLRKMPSIAFGQAVGRRFDGLDCDTAASHSRNDCAVVGPIAANALVRCELCHVIGTDRCDKFCTADGLAKHHDIHLRRVGFFRQLPGRFVRQRSAICDHFGNSRACFAQRQRRQLRRRDRSAVTVPAALRNVATEFAASDSPVRSRAHIVNARALFDQRAFCCRPHGRD